ncbi:hypothetical protein [Pseudomonas aeruginosa]|uniref:hypothetical protein n=1 Tax=Pseudomonas aeruginosa TaxID=287 RepID=UPI002904C9FF|nr:hypothetical protein [Pseudomonas aeruginosa]MDU0602382.1 hypothetical protein [Pseudomonas aeruginosa]
MNKANECTCPSGDGSLVHPCPAHPAVEQVGGDERAAFELFVRKHCGMPAHIAVNWDAKFTNDAWAGWQARAALAQPSPKCATCNGSKVVSTTDTDHNGDYIEAPCPKCGGTGEADSGGVHPWGEPVLIPCDCETEKAEAERPEVFGLERYRVERTGQGFWPYCVRAGDGTRELFVGHLKQCKRVAAQLATAFEDGKFVAGALRAENAKLIEALDESDGDRWRLRSERDAALARVAALESKLAELEKQEPVATVARVPGEDWNGLHFYRDLQGIPSGTKLYTAPVAQAQHSVPEGFIGRLSEFLAQRGATGKALLRELRALCAAAPGKEVGHE